MDKTTFTVKWDALQDGEFPIDAVAELKDVIIVVEKTGIFTRLVHVTFVGIGHSSEGEKMTTSFMLGQLIGALCVTHRLEIKL